jgi:dTMP kinase
LKSLNNCGLSCNDGKILVIEGTDFSGKTTQFDMLKLRLSSEGYVLGTDSFPNYESESSYFVRSYLGGLFSETAAEVDPKVASMFYALDRYASFKTKEWGQIYRASGNVLFARYISSNILHQASKYRTFQEKIDFIKWLYDLEVGLLGIPRESKVVILDMPPATAQYLKKKRLEEQHGLSSSGGEKDIHEDDSEHLINAYNTAMEIADVLNWEVIHCVDTEGHLKSREAINDELYDIATKLYNK